MASLKDLEDGPRMVAVTGKGGVGKTTCSAAAAVQFAGTGQRTLLLSTDRSPSLSDILDRFEGDTYDRIVWDTAPAGSTISLLDLQEEFYDRLGTAPNIYADLRSLARGEVKKRPGELFEEWRELAADCLEMVQGNGTAFVVVTIPEGLGVNETDRIIADLEDHDLDVRRVVANMVLSDVTEADCSHHRERADMHAEYLVVLEDRYADEYGLATVPQLPREVKRLEAIETVADTLFENER
ncbi:ArsA family ATPase [Halalkaliarchaeum desulfuricum]|nr:ArsA family ATPase [Halalkaliarchaeum desulfuricum]